MSDAKEATPNRRRKAGAAATEEANKKHKTELAPIQYHVQDNLAVLPPDSNQALGLGQFAIAFLNGSIGTGPAASVFKRVELFHTDSVVCGLSALAMRTNAPTVLREEALDYVSTRPKGGACVFGDKKYVKPEKAIAANIAAVREWDSNGTVFGYDKKRPGHTAGEFGHNDFYPVAIAACQAQGYDGHKAALAMILVDEIRGRLAEVFSLKTYKIDHVVHGAIASAAVYGALLGATAEQIESAIGMVIAHYIPWRAIRAGHQLSDSKGASAALSTEVAILSVLRSMRGFVGPKDIFRNPESLFRQFKKTDGSSPFEIVLAHSGEDFAVMGMHFKLGLYEHQSAGALQGLISVIQANPQLASGGAAAAEPAGNGAAPMDVDTEAKIAAGGAGNITSIKILCYEPAFGIIGDPAKRDPHTRQSADHSMVYIVATKLKHALQLGADAIAKYKDDPKGNDELWKALFLAPSDYTHEAIFDPVTRDLMSKIVFEHGGKEFDDNYPDGIPTEVVITDKDGKTYNSGMVMYPSGHARNTTCDLVDILDNKFKHLAALAVGEKKADELLKRLGELENKSADDIQRLYGDIKIVFAKQAME